VVVQKHEREQEPTAGRAIAKDILSFYK